MLQLSESREHCAFITWLLESSDYKKRDTRSVWILFIEVKAITEKFTFRVCTYIISLEPKVHPSLCVNGFSPSYKILICGITLVAQSASKLPLFVCARNLWYNFSSLFFAPHSSCLWFMTVEKNGLFNKGTYCACLPTVAVLIKCNQFLSHTGIKPSLTHII